MIIDFSQQIFERTISALFRRNCKTSFDCLLFSVTYSSFAALCAIIADFTVFSLENSDIIFFPIIHFLFGLTAFDYAAVKIFLAMPYMSRGR